jgi:hypothetical protein
LAISAPTEQPVKPAAKPPAGKPPAAKPPAAKRDERRALGVASGAHVLHDGYTDLVWLALPIWQAEFGLSYAAVGFLRTIFSGAMAAFQIPASLIAERIGAAAVLAGGTALCGLCYGVAGASTSFVLLCRHTASRRRWQRPRRHLPRTGGDGSRFNIRSIRVSARRQTDSDTCVIDSREPGWFPYWQAFHLAPARLRP